MDRRRQLSRGGWEILFKNARLCRKPFCANNTQRNTLRACTITLTNIFSTIQPVDKTNALRGEKTHLQIILRHNTYYVLAVKITIDAATNEICFISTLSNDTPKRIHYLHTPCFDTFFTLQPCRKVSTKRYDKIQNYWNTRRSSRIRLNSFTRKIRVYNAVLSLLKSKRIW